MGKLIRAIAGDGSLVCTAVDSTDIAAEEERVMAQLRIRRSVHLLINRHSFCPAGSLVIDPLPHLFPLLWNVFFSSIQLVRCGVGAVNGIRQHRIFQILRGKLEPGGLVLFAANVHFRRSAADIFHFPYG